MAREHVAELHGNSYTQRSVGRPWEYVMGRHFWRKIKMRLFKNQDLS